MADETKTAVDSFLGDLRNDGSKDPLEQTSEDPFKSTATEEKGEEVKEVEKKVPFHKDPKVQRYIQKEIEKLTKDISKPATEPEDTKDIDEVLTRIIGNDTEEKKRAVQDFKKVLLEREDRGAEKAYERYQQDLAQEKQEEAEAEEELLTGFEAIEDTYGVDLDANKKLKGQFIDFIRKVAPKNEDGEVIEFPDLVETYEVFQSTRKTDNSANVAKQLASRSGERGTTTTSTNPAVRKDWNYFEKFKDSLLG